MKLALTFAALLVQAFAFNGDLAELECPDECDCHYFRINWVTDCSDSNLTEIPYGELSPNVYILDMNSNRVKEIQPFPNEIKMRRLQIADNLITYVKKGSFAGLHYLIDADLSDNKITTVDPDTFEEMYGFITLELQGNPLQHVDGPFLSSRYLQYLDISYCKLKDLNSQFFANVTALSSLDLSGNPLGTIENEVFEPLVSLEVLKINNCNLTHISDGSFVGQVGLKTLELAGNFLTNQDWTVVLGPLGRLEYLDLRNTSVITLNEDTFDNNSFIRTLILAENELVGFDVAFTIGQKLHELETLDVSYCHLNKPLSEDAFSNSTKLRVLNLSGNSLFASDLLVALAPLSELEKLSLSNCGLSRLPDTFHAFKGLKELDISHNPLNDVFTQLLTPLENLEFLNMGYSNLSYISPTTFTTMTSMRRLVLSGNDLLSLEPGLFGGLTRLESLEMNNCGLRRPFNATVFFNNLTYTDLTELQLEGNPLQVSKHGPLLPKQLSRLEILNLANCNLTFLPPEAFFWTRNITSLGLSGNQFSSPDDFKFIELLPQLAVLDVRHNNLTTFSPKIVEANPNIEKLRLLGNPWRCDCSVADLWDWANIQKGNLGILEGSTLDAEHITVGKSKKKKLLVCNYDASFPMPMLMNKTASGRRPFIRGRLLLSTNRTWAKYVRESDCDQKINHARQERSIAAAESYEREVIKNAQHPPNTWAAAAVNALILYTVLMVLISVVYFAFRNKYPRLPTRGDATDRKDN